jgi:hypothetical protein
MNTINTERKTGLNIGRIILIVFLLAAGVAIISLILGVLESSGIIRLPPLIYYALGSTVGRLLGLAVQLVIIALIIKFIGMIRDRWRKRKENTQ